MMHRYSFPSILFLAVFLGGGILALPAQEISRCAQIVSGYDTISGSVFYFTRSVELRLVAPSPGTILHYTLDGSEPQRSSPVYTRPLLFSASAILNYLSIENGRKETRCPTLILRRIDGIESITLSAGNYSVKNGSALALLDTLQTTPLTFPSNHTRATLLINKGIVTSADSIGLEFIDEGKNEIRKIDFYLSADGKSFFRLKEYRIRGSQIKEQKTFNLPTGSEAFRYLKIDLKLKKNKNSELRILPLKAIKIYERPIK